MAQSPHPDDRPDPNENMPAMRARVPEHLHRGVFSTGVIVMTGGTEFVLDFVQNLGRPHQIVARVVIPHVVMPQFADALGKNIELYKQRFGPLPNPMIPGQTPIQNTSPERELPPAAIQSESQIVGGFVDSDNPAPSGSQDTARETANPVSKTPFASGMVPGSLASSGQGTGEAVPQSGPSQVPPANVPPAIPPVTPAPAPAVPPPPPQKRPTAQEIYDDFKLRDEMLSGSYANAVMIGHGPHEFSFDFITNFYPQSSVSARVFMAAGQVQRLLESLRAAWDQSRPR
ncbi:MAG: DUF3467 domain-containing protein [Pirellulales bacterium]